MGAGSALLDPADVQVPVLKSDQLGCPSLCRLGHKDHGGVPVGWRLPLAASIRRTTSASVRYSASAGRRCEASSCDLHHIVRS